MEYPGDLAIEPESGLVFVLGGVEGSMKVFRIAVKAQNVFQFDFARDFWLGNSEGEGNLRLFVHLADDAAQAGELVLLMREELAYGFKPATEGEGEYGSGALLLQQPVLKTWLALSRKGPVVRGLERAGSPEGARDRMTRLERAVATMEAR